MIRVSLLKGRVGSALADAISTEATGVLYSSAAAMYAQAGQRVLAWPGFSFAFSPLLFPHKEEKTMRAKRGVAQNLPSYPETR